MARRSGSCLSRCACPHRQRPLPSPSRSSFSSRSSAVRSVSHARTHSRADESSPATSCSTCRICVAWKCACAARWPSATNFPLSLSQRALRAPPGWGSPTPTRLDVAGDPVDLLRGEGAEERALPRAVAADEPVAPPVRERERGVLDEVLPAVAHGEVHQVDVPRAAGARVAADNDRLLWVAQVGRQGARGASGRRRWTRRVTEAGSRMCECQSRAEDWWTFSMLARCSSYACCATFSSFFFFFSILASSAAVATWGWAGRRLSSSGTALLLSGGGGGAWGGRASFLAHRTEVCPPAHGRSAPARSNERSACDRRLRATAAGAPTCSPSSP